jgi:uncharacterized membrane protein YeiH
MLAPVERGGIADGTLGSLTTVFHVLIRDLVSMDMPDNFQQQLYLINTTKRRLVFIKQSHYRPGG